MSSFYCGKCGKKILKGEGGEYITECKHYPKEKLNQLDRDNEKAFKLGLKDGERK